MAQSPQGGPRNTLLVKVADLFVYVLGVLVAVLLGSTLLAIPLAGTFLIVKYLFFLIGFVLVGYGTALLWPSNPAKRSETGEDRTPDLGGDLSPFESVLARLLSGLDDRYPPTERFSPGLKVFLAGCSVLVVSYLMEAILQIGVE
jgi:hypothetical protein